MHAEPASPGMTLPRGENTIVRVRELLDVDGRPTHPDAEHARGALLCTGRRNGGFAPLGLRWVQQVGDKSVPLLGDLPDDTVF